MFGSQEIGSGLVSLEMIFEALQSELLRFIFSLLSSKIPKIPGFNLIMTLIWYEVYKIMYQTTWFVYEKDLVFQIEWGFWQIVRAIIIFSYLNILAVTMISSKESVACCLAMITICMKAIWKQLAASLIVSYLSMYKEAF